MDKVSKCLSRHYKKTFQQFGATSKGVDWGDNEANLYLRYDKMLQVLDDVYKERLSILDVGCGYGGLLDHIIKKNINLKYTGIDIVGNMVRCAKKNHRQATFITGDIFKTEFIQNFDYVVCNGILTQKLDVSGLAMDEFAGRLIRRLFEVCEKGMAFNIMTTKVNYFANNLYYRNPAELFSWCLSDITPHIKIDHAYNLFEYTVYLYK